MGGLVAVLLPLVAVSTHWVGQILGEVHQTSWAFVVEAVAVLDDSDSVEGACVAVLLHDLEGLLVADHDLVG